MKKVVAVIAIKRSKLQRCVDRRGLMVKNGGGKDGLWLW